MESIHLSELRTEAHIWLAVPELSAEPNLLAGYEILLSDNERERYQRYLFERDRRHYLVAHVLKRTVLSHYVNVAPTEWIFHSNHFGRPEIAAPKGIPPLRFNLSHTQGLVACIVTLKIDVGIDVEQIRLFDDLLSLARHSFSTSEFDALCRLPVEARQKRFFAYWTLKEAYIKARGVGLSLPLDRFYFLLKENGGIDIELHAYLHDHPSNWQFMISQPTLEHQLAVAIRRGVGTSRTIVQRWCTPIPC